jgi:hypothetical protein
VPAAAYFVSHCWSSACRWKHFEKVDRLVSELEDASRERVWFDQYEMDGEQDFRAAMEHGVRGAGCVIVCLSRSYLASENCLLELKAAREQHLERGTKLVLIAMEPEVLFAAVRGWESGADVQFDDGEKARRVHRHTVDWVKKHLLGFKINEEWAAARSGAGTWSQERAAVLEEIIRGDDARGGGSAGRFEVGADGEGGHFIRDAELPGGGGVGGKRGAAEAGVPDAARERKKVARGAAGAEGGGGGPGLSGSKRGREDARVVVVGFFAETKWDAANPHAEAQELRNLFNRRRSAPPPPPSRTKWTRLVHPPY